MTAALSRPARRRCSARLLVVVRLLAVLFSLQLGGLVHDVTDVVAAIADIQHDEERCPLDGPCDDCPAGCPNCHCPNALGAFVPASSSAALVDPTTVDTALPLLDRGRAPEGPVLPSIYRPPRGSTRS